MPQNTSTFRVFISSTFSDLKEERNALQERVFPKLRKLALDHQCQFQAIDLRWGVSEEASIDQKTMDICLGEIERCQRITPRPNFLVLMGDRYGWTPPPPQILADEFEHILKFLTPEEHKLLVWKEEGGESMVRWDPEKKAYIGDKGWYRLDHNAAPAAYALQPWEGFSYEAWGEIEKSIHAVLEKGARAASLDDQALFKYWSSATHQEIEAGALRVGDDARYVHCFLREVEGYPSAFSAPAFLAELDERMAEHYPEERQAAAFEDWVGMIKQIAPASNARQVSDLIKDLLKEAPKGSLERGFLEQVQGWLADFCARDFLNLKEDDWTPDAAALSRQKALKEKLGTHIPGNIKHYDARWNGRGVTTSHIDQFCTDVYDALSTTILSELESSTLAPAAAAKELLIVRDAGLDEEGAAHHAFAEDRLAYFVGRTEILSTISSYLADGEGRVLAICGKGGTGKSALTAKAIQQAQKAYPESAMIYRFIGATPNSSDGRALLSSLCREISRRCGASEGEIPLDYKDLVPEFGKRLGLATAQQPLILFLDSLDQLSSQHGARSLAWLPDILPAHAHIVVTSRDEEETYDCLQAKKILIETLGGLSRQEGEQLLSAWLADAGRTLQVGQREEVLDKFVQSGGPPLYLKLAFEEARLWPSADGQPPEHLAPGIEGIIERNLIDRLADEDSHGKKLVSKVLGYLAASRYGLAEDEIIDLLSRDLEMYEWFLKKSMHLPADLMGWAIRYRRGLEDGQPIEDRAPDKDEERAAQAWLKEIRTPPERVSVFLKDVLPKEAGPKLPVVLWSRLFFDLEPYLSKRESEGATLLAFYHRELNDVSSKVFLGEREGLQIHANLASYFRFKSDPGGKGDWLGGYPRGLSELPYHLTRAEMWDAVYETLTDFCFLEHKAAEVGVLESRDEEGKQIMVYSGVFQLQEDYERALGAMPGGEGAGSGGGEPPLILTAMDRGQGLTIYCPACNQTSLIAEEQLDRVITCPQPNCSRRLKINASAVKAV